MTINDDTITIGPIAGGHPTGLVTRDSEDIKLATLAAMPLFAGVSTKTLKQVAALLGLERRAAGEILLREGTASDMVMVLVQGYATASQQGRRVGVAGAGELLGDPTQLHRRTSAMSWTTETETIVLTATPQAVREIYALVPQTYVRLTSTSEEADRIEASDPAQDVTWLVGLLGTLLFLAVITGSVYVAGALGAFQ